MSTTMETFEPQRAAPVGETEQVISPATPAEVAEEIVASVARASALVNFGAPDFGPVLASAQIPTSLKDRAGATMAHVGFSIAQGRLAFTLFHNERNFPFPFVDDPSLRALAAENGAEKLRAEFKRALEQLKASLFDNLVYVEKRTLDAARAEQALSATVTRLRQHLPVWLNAIRPKNDREDRAKTALAERVSQLPWADRSRWAEVEREGLLIELECRALYDGLVSTAPEAHSLGTAAVSEAIPDEVKEALGPILERWPALARSAAKVEETLPNIFTEPDPQIGRSFAETLVEMVAQGRIREAHEIERLFNTLGDPKQFRQMPEFSHTTMLANALLETRPVLALDLMRAAQDGRDYPLAHVYGGDGPDAIPMGSSQPHAHALANGLWPVGDMGAGISLERGLQMVARDVLKPSVLPPYGIQKGRCSPAAVAFSRLFGEPIRYERAYGIKTGEDLVKALEHQGRRGLAMSNVMVASPDLPRSPRNLHFPRFFDFDPKTRTVAVQIWIHTDSDLQYHRYIRVHVDSLSFPDFNPDRRPSIYYTPAPSIDGFITP
jgi:hypothetical protein